MYLYIHGFNSSPASHKAELLRRYLAARGERCLVPHLSWVPDEAVDHLESLIGANTNDDIVLVGSSLGGYYAAYLAERYQCKAILINPAIRPYELLRDYIGRNRNMYTGLRYTLATHHVEQLCKYEVNALTSPQQLLLLLQTGDELLDYRQALIKYQASPSIVIEGGSHGFDGFEKVMDHVINFGGKNITGIADY